MEDLTISPTEFRDLELRIDHVQHRLEEYRAKLRAAMRAAEA